MIDLTALQTALAGLGPWGIFIGIALTFAVQYLRARQNPAPTTPADPANPNPAPAPQPAPKTPILDALLNLLRLRLTRDAAAPVQYASLPQSRDIDDETLNKLFGAITTPPVAMKFRDARDDLRS